MIASDQQNSCLASVVMLLKEQKQRRERSYI